jgi:hypothetical protein
MLLAGRIFQKKWLSALLPVVADPWCVAELCDWIAFRIANLMCARRITSRHTLALHRW